jgi:beta-glucanase (GH16 family)
MGQLATVTLLICCVAAVAGAQVPPMLPENGAPLNVAAGYDLVWSDEFNVAGRPQAENWRCERGFVRNEELQWYQPENAWCENGLLIIEARRQRVGNPRYDPTSSDWRRNRKWAEYTSACLTTRGRHHWRYGCILVRGRIDTRPGLWPAFWTLGTTGRWPACGEVDIMEYYRGQLLANAAWLGEGRTAKWDTTRRPLEQLGGPDWPSRFHIWRMHWDRGSIRLLVDDQLLNEVDLDATVNNDADRVNPFRESQYLLLNLAIGGTQGGNPAATEFPARLEVDYVRVYQCSGPADRTNGP